MDLPDDLPARPAAEAVRLVALELLGDARREAGRLGDAQDAEALHDFRVAVRRLRSHLRAWRGQLEGSVRRRHRRALRGLQEATGSGRDAEVALEWLGQLTEVQPEHRRGLELAAAHESGRRGALDAQAARELRERFDEVDAELHDALPRLRVELRLDRPRPGPTWAEALAEAARAHVAELLSRLEGARSPDDEEALHAGRIAGKRLRYLLEPARSYAPAARALVARLKALQDVLGEIHDAHVLAVGLARLVEHADAERERLLLELDRPEEASALRERLRATPRPGLLELQRRNRGRLERLYATLCDAWTDGGLETLREQVESFAQAFEARGRPGVERERKYLLARMPDVPGGAEVLEIEQGWLPGEALRERLRRTRGAQGERLQRALKLGRGVERVEVEEAIEPALFAALWPLTEGCRVRKRRHRVRAGAHVWEIDEFLDRDLVLAEVELEDARERPAPPAWLARQVVREVTDEPAFTNLALAESGANAAGG